jgi:hypothetical protein
MLGSKAMSDRETSQPASEPLPDPAAEALREPHLDAEDLEQEIGDSESWDEASEETGDVDEPQNP